MTLDPSGFQSQWAIGTTTPLTVGIEVDSGDLTAVTPHIDTSGLRATREHFSDRVVAGPTTVAGSITCYPSPEELTHWLPLILGGANSGNNYPIAETLSSFYLQIDKGSNIQLYSGCVVNKATFSAAEGAAMKLVVDVIGQTETPSDEGGFPSVTYANTTPWSWAQCALTLNSSARNVKDWSLTLDNHLSPQFYNSQTATAILTQDRTITLDANLPNNVSNLDLYTQAVAGAAGSLVMTQGAKILTFSFGIVQIPHKGPVVQGRSPIMYPINATVRRSSGAVSLAVTLPLS